MIYFNPIIQLREGKYGDDHDHEELIFNGVIGFII